ncbi:MAG: amidohydrolase [bacterium]
MSEFSSRILEEARGLKKELISLRRHFHRGPELGNCEFETAAIVSDYLEKLGLPVQRGVAGTGVVALLEGNSPGKVLGLRADMDALPITEKSEAEYVSLHSGVMHACGHDGHMAILLGAARLLCRHREQLSGSVKFIFQPAEEGPGGALPMIQAGILQNPKVDAMLAFHLFMDLPVGTIGLCFGPVTAAADELALVIHGRGGHAAYPHTTVDTIHVAAQLIVALHSITSRNIDPLQPAVLTIGTIAGGYRQNVIADEVTMRGTVRTMDPGVRIEMEKRIREVTDGVTRSWGAEYTLTYTRGYPSTINEQTLASMVHRTAVELLGGVNVQRLNQPTMGAEDFSYFAQAVPAVMVRLGGSNSKKGMTYPHHHPSFDFDEEALPVGTALMSTFALDYLAP